MPFVPKQLSIIRALSINIIILPLIIISTEYGHDILSLLSNKILENPVMKYMNVTTLPSLHCCRKNIIRERYMK